MTIASPTIAEFFCPSIPKESLYSTARPPLSHSPLTHLQKLGFSLLLLGIGCGLAGREARRGCVGSEDLLERVEIAGAGRTT
ncbi:MAG: hypothetical protein MH252_07750 [Thermosynechococcaceae cyanobacterium MS004]|nr:hypothetical protein [Thermosynechococcaceae cyanobacterium MS004]